MRKSDFYREALARRVYPSNGILRTDLTKLFSRGVEPAEGLRGQEAETALREQHLTLVEDVEDSEKSAFSPVRIS